MPQRNKQPGRVQQFLPLTLALGYSHSGPGFRGSASVVHRHAHVLWQLLWRSFMGYFGLKLFFVFGHIKACLWFMSFKTFIVIFVFSRLFTMAVYTE